MANRKSKLREITLSFNPRYKFIEPDNVPLRIAFKKPNAFVIIPKVASSTMSAALLHYLKWSNHESVTVRQMIDNGNKWNFWGLVRHPLDRWISGITQKYAPWYDIKDANPEDLEYQKLLVTGKGMEWFVNHGWHDQHTQPQSWHYRGIPNLKLYKLESFRLFWHDIGLNPPQNPNVAHLNAAKDRGDQWKTYGQVRELLYQHPDYVNKLLKLYKDDLELWRKAK